MKSVLQDLRSMVPAIASDVAAGAVRSIESYQRAGPALIAALEAVADRVTRKVIQLWDENRPADTREIGRMAEIAIAPADTGIMLDDMLRTSRIAEEVIWSAFHDAALERTDLSPSAILDAATIIQTFFNEATSAITRIYLDAEPRHLFGRRDAQRVFVDAVVAEPPRMEQAMRVARSLGLQADEEWQARVATLADAHATVAVSATDRVSVRYESRVIVLGGPCASLPDSTSATIGIGGSHRGLHGIRTSYIEALEALAIAHRKGASMIFYERAWLDRYLRGTLTAIELMDLVFAPFAKLSPSKRKTWERTLEVWLDCVGNVAQMSEILNLHPQSTRYRIGRLKDMFARILEAPDGRLAMHIAVKASQLIDRKDDEA